MMNVIMVFSRHNCFSPKTLNKWRHFSITEHRQSGHWRFETASRMRYILLVAALVTISTGLKIGVESQVLQWAVGNGYTQFSKLILKCGLNVDASNFRMESPLHGATNFGSKLGRNVNVKARDSNSNRIPRSVPESKSSNSIPRIAFTLNSNSIQRVVVSHKSVITGEVIVFDIAILAFFLPFVTSIIFAGKLFLLFLKPQHFSTDRKSVV